MPTTAKAVYVRRGLVWSNGADMVINVITTSDTERLTLSDEDKEILGTLYTEEHWALFTREDILKIAQQIRLQWFKEKIGGDPDTDEQIPWNTINNIKIVDHAGVLGGWGATLFTDHSEVYGPIHEFAVKPLKFIGDEVTDFDANREFEAALMRLPRSTREKLKDSLESYMELEDQFREDTINAKFALEAEAMELD